MLCFSSLYPVYRPFLKVVLHISTCININMFSFGNYIWKTFKIKMLHPLTLPQHQPIPQLQTLTQHQPLQDPPQIAMVNNLKSLHQGKEMLMIEKSHKFRITLQNLIMILKPLELNVIIVKRIMHVILLLMRQIIYGVI